MKKCISAVLIILTAVTIVPISSAPAKALGGKIHSYFPAVENYYPGIESRIANGIRNLHTGIDISSYNMGIKDAQYCFESAVVSNPDIFYVDSLQFDYTYNRNTGQVKIVKPKYIFSKSKIPSYISKFNNAVNKLTVNISSSWTQDVIALELHDRLVSTCQYKKENRKSQTAYSAIVSRKSVCDGYSRAYSYLLSRYGIENKMIRNDSGKHVWNLVKIAGYWYHVDVTHDDPTPDTTGQVKHDFLLLSDSMLSSLNSYSNTEHMNYKNNLSYSNNYACYSNNFSNAIFKNMKTQLTYYNGYFYYICNSDNSSGKSYLIKQNQYRYNIEYTINEKWYSSSGLPFTNTFSTLCVHNGWIYFNSARTIYKYSPYSGIVYREFTLPSSWKLDLHGIKSAGNYIVGLRRKPGAYKDSISKLLYIDDYGYTTIMPYILTTKKTLSYNQTYKMKVYEGSGTTVYKTSNKYIAKVSKKGTIRATGYGTAKVTATKNGKTMTCTITVR